MNWRGRLKSLPLFLTVAMLSVMSVAHVFMPLPAKAAGSQRFELRSNQRPELLRTNQDTMIISSWLKVTEVGIQPETFALFRFKQTLTLQPDDDTVDDEWKVTRIEMYDLQNEASYGSNGSVITSPVLAFFRNRGNELIASVDYRALPNEVVTNNDNEVERNILPCYRVYTDPRFGTDNSAIPINGTSTGCGTGKNTGSRTSPANTVAANVNAWGNTTGDDKPIVQNYDLSGGDIDENYTKDRIENWFRDVSISGLVIERLEEAGKPPYIDVRADSNRGRPKIRFVLSHIGAEGSGWVIWKNIDWYVFDAYELDSNNNQVRKINHLYILLNDGLGVNVTYDENRTGIDKGKFEEITDNLDIPENNMNRFFGYTSYNVPKDPGENNCAEEPVFTVDPSGTTDGPDNFRHYSNIRSRTNEARLLNGSCIVPDKGWPAYWGVSVNSVPHSAANDGGCSFNWIIDGGVFTQLAGAGKNQPPDIINELGIDPNQLDNPMTRLTICIYAWIVHPLVEWGAEQIENAGGVAYYSLPKFKVEEIVFDYA